MIRTYTKYLYVHIHIRTVHEESECNLHLGQGWKPEGQSSHERNTDRKDLEVNVALITLYVCTHDSKSFQTHAVETSTCLCNYVPSICTYVHT